MFGPTATLNFGASAPSPGDAAAHAQPQPPQAFPASVPDGAEQLAMLASAPSELPAGPRAQSTPDWAPTTGGSAEQPARYAALHAGKLYPGDWLCKCKACLRAAYI